MTAEHVRIRAAWEHEYPLLERFLYEAIFVPEGAPPPEPDIVRHPELRIYVENFGSQVDDHCLAAVCGEEVVGMVWVRIMEDYGHVDAATPSLSIAVLPGYRGRGIGTRLLLAMHEHLRDSGYRRISLSVQKLNPALRLYRRLGYDVVQENETDLVMVRQLRTEEE
ncbi:MAG: GNAT family N-acetyltransferase [Bacillota bacterium]|nr:GNAT family N-acetyltransferase [Bacillota bacterium]